MCMVCQCTKDPQRCVHCRQLIAGSTVTQQCACSQLKMYVVKLRLTSLKARPVTAAKKGPTSQTADGCSATYCGTACPFCTVYMAVSAGSARQKAVTVSALQGWSPDSVPGLKHLLCPPHTVPACMGVWLRFTCRRLQNKGMLQDGVTWFPPA